MMSGHKVGKLIERQWLAEKEALQLVALMLAQPADLIHRFNTLGNYCHAKLVAHFKNNLKQRSFLRIDKIAINLQARNRVLLQVGQIRIASTEIVNRYLDALATQGVQQIVYVGFVDYQHRLCHFNVQALGINAGIGYRPINTLCEIIRHELFWRDIDRHRNVVTGRFPSHLVSHSLTHYPLTNLKDHTGLFRYRNKVKRADHALGWMIPSDQCLDSGHSKGFTIDFGLVVKYKLIGLKRQRQISLECQSIERALVHALFVRSMPTTGRLGRIHSNVCVLQQRGGRLTIRRVTRNANTG